MSKRKRGKNRIDVQKARELFKGGYALFSRELNYFTLRLWSEESKSMFDWFHTTGTLAKVSDGFYQKLGVLTDPEEVAILINKELDKEIY